VIETLLDRMQDDLPALQIAVPLLAATLCLLARRARAACAVAMVVVWGSFASAWVILGRVLATGTISYAEGGWVPPWGIELRIDLLNALVLLIVTGICAIVLTAAPRSLDQEVPRAKHYQFYAVYLLCMTGLAGMTLPGSTLYIG
jgi:multicomponent Na+:H+ antiporter subunit D